MRRLRRADTVGAASARLQAIRARDRVPRRAGAALVHCMPRPLPAQAVRTADGVPARAGPGLGDRDAGPPPGDAKGATDRIATGARPYTRHGRRLDSDRRCGNERQARKRADKGTASGNSQGACGSGGWRRFRRQRLHSEPASLGALINPSRLGLLAHSSGSSSDTWFRFVTPAPLRSRSMRAIQHQRPRSWALKGTTNFEPSLGITSTAPS